MSKIQCTSCDDIIESTSVHDYLICKCTEIFLDGGNEYLRYGWTKEPPIIIETPKQAIEKELG